MLNEFLVDVCENNDLSQNPYFFIRVLARLVRLNNKSQFQNILGTVIIKLIWTNLYGTLSTRA